MPTFQMVGTVPTGGRVRWSRSSVEMVVVDRWQDEVTVQSTTSGRRYRWQDTEYVWCWRDSKAV